MKIRILSRTAAPTLPLSHIDVWYGNIPGIQVTLSMFMLSSLPDVHYMCSHYLKVCSHVPKAVFLSLSIFCLLLSLLIHLPPSIYTFPLSHSTHPIYPIGRDGNNRTAPWSRSRSSS